MQRVDKQTNTQNNLSLIPLPKFDEMYANLCGAKNSHYTWLCKVVTTTLLWTRNSRLNLHLSHPLVRMSFYAVPFGLAQAPAYFQQLISIVLQDCGDFAMAYFDDIIIFSKNEAGASQTHWDHLQETAKRWDSSSKSPNVISSSEKSII